jgi:site-specific recombinase XerD
MDDTLCLTQFEHYLTRRSPGRSTAKHYLSDLRQFQKVCPKTWSTITSGDIDAFVDAGQARGWKAATLQRRVAALKVFFDFYADLQQEPDRPNPVQLHTQAPRVGQRLPHDVPDEIIERLWLAIDQPRDQLWFTLMLRGGLRVSEVASLNREAILAPATPDQPARLRVKGKGCKERIVYLTADAYAVLARWLMLMPGAPAAPVCVNARGQRITVNGIQERLRHYCQTAGIHLTCHQLRHTYARQLVEHELPVATLAKLLGHASLTTTEIYIAGADPQVRAGYQQAMHRWEQATQLPPGTPPPPTPDRPAPSPDPPPIPPPPQAPSAQRPPNKPLPELATQWGLDLPTWVRDPCLDYVRHQARQWKASQCRRHSQRTLRVLRRFWNWRLARGPIGAWTELTRDDMRAFADDLTARSAAPSTVRNAVYPVWGVLRSLQTQGVVIAPSLFRVDLPHDRHLVPRALTDVDAQSLERQMHAYLAHPTPEALRDAAWYFVLAHAGLRLNELVDLRRADLDLTSRRLRIEQGKGRRDRSVFLSDTTVVALERYLATVPTQAADAPLFFRADGVPLKYRWVQFRLRQLGEDAGVLAVSPHRLRHTFATRLINLGVPITTIQHLLGHTNLNTTQRYAHVADPTIEREYRQAMQILEKETGALALAPVPLDALLSGVRSALSRVTEPLDNSM